MEKTLKNTPDIDVLGKIYDYGYRPECLETLGMTNQVDIFEALDRARNKETIDYIISSRGGIEKTAKMLEDMGGQEGKHISLQNAKYLMERNIPETSIEPSILVYDKDVFKQMVIAQNKSKKSSGTSNMGIKKSSEQNNPSQSNAEDSIQKNIKQLRGLSSSVELPSHHSVNKVNTQTFHLYQNKKKDISK